MDTSWFLCLTDDTLVAVFNNLYTYQHLDPSERGPLSEKMIADISGVLTALFGELCGRSNVADALLSILQKMPDSKLASLFVLKVMADHA